MSNYWTGMWSGLWTGLLDLDRWTWTTGPGPLDWSTGLDYCLDFCFTSLPLNQMCRFGYLPYVLISSFQFMPVNARDCRATWTDMYHIMISWSAHSEIKHPLAWL